MHLLRLRLPHRRPALAVALAAAMIASLGGVAAASPQVASASAPDVRVTVTGSPAAVDVGSPVTYTVTVSNQGTERARGVELVSALPAGLTKVRFDVEQGRCELAENGRELACDLGDVRKSDPVTLTLDVTPGAAGTQVVAAAATTTSADAAPGNNMATAETVVSPGPADVSVTAVGSPTSVTLAAPVTYTVTVANAGPGRATEVELVNTLPDDVIYNSVEWSQGGDDACTEDDDVVTCALGAIVKGATATVTIGVTPAGFGSRTNTAAVSAAEDDPQPANNVASASTAVNPPGTPEPEPEPEPDPDTSEPDSPAAPRCFGKAATKVGTSGADRIRGTAGNDVIVARGGNDRIDGRGGNDRICGGGGGSDTVAGGSGNDRLAGDGGRDAISGGKGRDTITGGPGRDTITGGDGRDTVTQ